MLPNPRKTRAHLRKGAADATAEADDVEIVWWSKGSAGNLVALQYIYIYIYILYIYIYFFFCLHACIYIYIHVIYIYIYILSMHVCVCVSVCMSCVALQAACLSWQRAPFRARALRTGKGCMHACIRLAPAGAEMHAFTSLWCMHAWQEVPDRSQQLQDMIDEIGDVDMEPKVSRPARALPTPARAVADPALADTLIMVESDDEGEPWDWNPSGWPSAEEESDEGLSQETLILPGKCVVPTTEGPVEMEDPAVEPLEPWALFAVDMRGVCHHVYALPAKPLEEEDPCMHVLHACLH